MGGAYVNEYIYDRQYRLRQSNGSSYYPYTFRATYSRAGRMGEKSIDSYARSSLQFGYDKYYTTHQPRTAFDFIAMEDLNFFWDANGNLAQIMRCMQGGARLHEWDEENRLRFVLGDKYAGCYGYDGNGDRVYKLTGISSLSQQNAGGTIAQVTFDDAVLYPNPYTVITPKGYTKHYYAGTERLATVIGGGGFGDMTTPIASLSTAERTDLVDPFWERYSPHTEDPFFYSNTLSGDMITRNIEDKCIDELQYHCSPLPLEYVDALYQDNMLFDAILDYEQKIEIEKEIYYYHGDHLGSANWITNADGDAVQYIHYAPYGELIANQIPHGYDERYKFTGKERDAESGYDFFGARFLWSAIGHWLSVDPLADKYPNISPYAYCSWNPINAIDPDGREEWELDANTGKFQNIGNKGGSTTDYYSVGVHEGKAFSSCSNYEIERDEGTINSFRIQETDNSTISAFHIPETNVEGFFLERPGPDTEESGQSLRIPAGQYSMYENPGSRYPGVPRLYSPAEGVGGTFDQRGILMHIGNYPDDTKGCLLPGSSYAPDFVGNSGNTLKNIMNYIVTTGWGCKLNIYNTPK
jgi:RHS repeat-associated protein